MIGSNRHITANETMAPFSAWGWMALEADPLNDG
jgi:hypothetical protein